MLHILDIPPELLIAIYYRVLDSTSLANRHLAQLRFSKTCRMFKEVADTRTCLYIDTTSRLARLGAAIAQWSESRCGSVNSIIFPSFYDCLQVAQTHPSMLSRFVQLQHLGGDIGDLKRPEDIVPFDQLVCSLGTLTTLDLNCYSSTTLQVSVESVIDYLQNLPQLQQIILPFVSSKPPTTFHIISPHGLTSLKLSLRGPRECHFFTTLLPALPKLRSLFLGLLPEEYDNLIPLDDYSEGELHSDFEVGMLDSLAKSLERHGSSLTTFGFAPAIPHSSWYHYPTTMVSHFRLLHDVLPDTIEHILSFPHSSQFFHHLQYLSTRFPRLRHLTLTSETLSDEQRNTHMLIEEDLDAIVAFCQSSPCLEVLTIKGLDKRLPLPWENTRAHRHDPCPFELWDDFAREVKAMGKILECVGRDGY